VNIKKNAGFSLGEVMVAAALLGIVSLGVMRLVSNMSKSQKTFETASEITTISNGINQILTNEKACEQTFTGTSFGAASSITDIRNSTGDAVFSVGSTYGNRTVELLNLDIQNISLSTDGTSKSGTFDLAVRMRKTSRQAQGAKEVVKRIRVSVVTDLADNFASCFYSAAGATKNSCENVGGTFDTATQNCTLVPFPGIAAIPNTVAGQQQAVSQRYINDLLDDLYNDLDARYLEKGTEDLDNAVPPNVTVIGNSTSDTVRLNSTLVVDGVSTFNENILVANGKYVALQSDKRLKKNVKPLDKVLKKISKVRGVSFEWKESKSQDIGVIAQNIQKVFPELVVEEANSGKLMVKYPQLSAVNLQAVNELVIRNDNLESEVKSLKSALCSLHPELKVCD